MCGERLDDVGRGGVFHFDAVGDGQVHGPALVLEAAIEVAGNPFLAQLGRQGGVQSDEGPLIFESLQVPRALVDDLHVVPGELERSFAQGKLVEPAVPEGS